MDSTGHPSLLNAQQFDFDWVTTTRDHHVLGDYPHVSIEDKLFVECVGGDLTIKVEDNTNDGKGIYSEEVEDPHQSISDALIEYAFVGDLIALKVRPHREKHERYFIYNPLTQSVVRSDALKVSAKALPESHGLLYPNGYALTNGEHKQFDFSWQHLQFFQSVVSPNGEDVIYFFFNILDGYYVSFTYNMIEKKFSAPLESHGYSMYPDGRMLVFQLSENAEASTIHPLRIWDTPFLTPEYYAKTHEASDNSSPLFNLGNAELVRALSSVLSICQLSQSDEVTQAAYEALLKQCQTTLDHYHWLKHDYSHGLGESIDTLMVTADKIIDEFAKVKQLQFHATNSLEQHQSELATLFGKIKLAPKDQAHTLLSLLSEVRQKVGKTMALQQLHYVDLDSVQLMLLDLQSQRDDLNRQLLSLLQEEKAYQPFKKQIDQIEEELEKTDKTSRLSALQEQLDSLRGDLQIVTDEVTDIETDDPTQSTNILDHTTEVSSRLNSVSARLRSKSMSLRSEEAEAEFSAQFKLLAQSVSSAMEQALTPNDCDTQLAKLMAQLDKLESRFADFDQFLVEILTKRDEVQSTLESHKQQLITAQQRRIQNLLQAANVTMGSIEKRVANFSDVEELNSYFATDAMVLKLQQISESIRDLGDSVKSDSVDAKLKSLQDQSLRSLRDNQDIFEQGGTVLRLGKHRFSVNHQPLDLSLVEHKGALSTHISGTDFYQPITDAEFLSLQEVAKLDVASESDNVYRGEYLAYAMIHAAERNEHHLSIEELTQSLEDSTLLSKVQRYAAPRYKESYVKGVHDSDAEKILLKILPAYQNAGLLRFSQGARSQAICWLLNQAKETVVALREKALDADLLRTHLNALDASNKLKQELEEEFNGSQAQESAEYLVRYLSQKDESVQVSQDSLNLCEDYLQFRRSLGWEPTTSISIAQVYSDHLQWLEATQVANSMGKPLFAKVP